MDHQSGHFLTTGKLAISLELCGVSIADDHLQLSGLFTRELRVSFPLNFV